jgi:hypothetical protein
MVTLPERKKPVGGTALNEPPHLGSQWPLRDYDGLRNPIWETDVCFHRRTDIRHTPVVEF